MSSGKNKKPGKLLRASPEQWARYERAAKKSGPHGLTHWILTALDMCAEMDLSSTEQKIRKASR
jgi:hypothetical protein